MISQRAKAGKLAIGLCLIAVTITCVVRPAAAQTGTRAIPVALTGYSAVLSRDGKTLAYAADLNMYNEEVQPDRLPIHLIDIASGKETAQLVGSQTDFTTGLAFAPHAERLVSLHSNGQMNVWDVSRGKLVKSYQLPVSGYRQPQFLADGQHIMTLTSESPDYILTIDTENGAIIANYGPVIKTFGDYIKTRIAPLGVTEYNYIAFNVSPDGKTLAAATANDEVDLWDTATGKMSVLVPPAEKKAGLNIYSMVFTPDSKSLVYYHRMDNKLHIIDHATQQERLIGVTGGQAFALNVKGDQVAWVDQSQVYTWDLQAAQPTKVADLDPKFKVVRTLTRLFFTPDNTQLIVSGLTTTDTNNQIFIIPLAAPKS